MRVMIDILRLIVPSAEHLAARGNQELECLKEHTNAGWNSCIPVEGPRPQPDHCLGFRFSAFSMDQISKLNRNLKLGIKSYFSASLQMFFPFFTAEVKCGQQSLEIADCQNAHSMTVALRGIVELFRRVGRADELHGKDLCYSISLNDRDVRIYAHYAEIDGLETKCYRYLLKEFGILSEDGKEKWTAFQFVRNIQESRSPVLLKLIKSAIDQLPDPPLESLQSVVNTEGVESSQEMTGAGAPSSQEIGFKKPDLPKRGVTAELRRQIEGQQRQLEEAKQRDNQLREEARQEKEQLREEARQEKEQLRAQLEEAKQRDIQLREEARQEKEQLREEARQEKEQFRAQLAEITTLLNRRQGL